MVVGAAPLRAPPRGEGDAMSYPAPPARVAAPGALVPEGPRRPGPRCLSPAQAGGFFNDLFDIRFTRFVSLRLISVVYVVILIAVSLVALGFVFVGFAPGVGAGVFALVLAVLGWVIYVVLARVVLEAFAVLFRIHDDTSRMADALGAVPTSGGSGSGLRSTGGRRLRRGRPAGWRLRERWLRRRRGWPRRLRRPRGRVRRTDPARPGPLGTALGTALGLTGRVGSPGERADRFSGRRRRSVTKSMSSSTRPSSAGLEVPVQSRTVPRIRRHPAATSAWVACGQPSAASTPFLPRRPARHGRPRPQPEPLRPHRLPHVDVGVADDEHVRADGVRRATPPHRATPCSRPRGGRPGRRAGGRARGRRRGRRPRGRRRRPASRRRRPRRAGRRPRPSRRARRRAAPRRGSGTTGDPGAAPRTATEPLAVRVDRPGRRRRARRVDRRAVDPEARAEREGPELAAPVLEHDEVHAAALLRPRRRRRTQPVSTSSTTRPGSAATSGSVLGPAPGEPGGGTAVRDVRRPFTLGTVADVCRWTAEAGRADVPEPGPDVVSALRTAPWTRAGRTPVSASTRWPPS